MYGYREDRSRPLLHTKMLVLGCTYEDDDGFSGIHFRPDVVWIGSANWTSKADMFNTEAAVAVADRSFVHAATRQMADIISHSEPLNRYSATPTPNLTSTQLDTAACADYAAEFYMGR
ncbi:hypothetical protein [Actinoplanes sp. G11-F43]|uniref:hypothetical protein n=1 Tax=Actinoplanes sp. G11-F43 TaxID=3424130 RepID=UPI003D339EA3